MSVVLYGGAITIQKVYFFSRFPYLPQKLVFAWGEGYGTNVFKRQKQTFDF